MPRYFAPEERYNKFKAWREQRNLDAAGQGPQAPADPVWQSVARNVGTGPAPVLPPAPQPVPMPPPQLSVPGDWMQSSAPAIAPSTPVPSSMTVPSAWLAPYSEPTPLRLPKVPAFSAPPSTPPDGMNWQTADQMATPPTPTIPMPTRPYRNEAVDADLDALAAVPRDLAGAGLGAYNEFIGRPVTGLATELAGGREQEAYERQRGLPERADTGDDLGNWWRALSERQRARAEAGIASVPLGDVLPFTPGEYAGIARGVAPVARGLLGEVGAVAKSAPVAGAVRAADRAITSPSLKRLVPGATVEDVSKTAVPESWQTKGAQLQLGYGGDRDAFAISSKDASATGYLRNADFPNEAGRSDRGELFFVTAGPVQGTGIGTSLARDAIDLMVKNGATSVNMSITTEAGSNLVGRLLREGDIAGPIKTSPTGKAEYRILRGQIAPGLGIEDVSKTATPTSPLPKMVNNYRKPLSDYTDAVYHETSLQEAEGLMPQGGVIGDSVVPQKYMANTPDLALGQGRSKGVLLEFDAAPLQGQVNTAKPTWQATYDQGQAEFIATHNNEGAYRQALRSITIRPDAGKYASRGYQVRMQRLLGSPAYQDWAKIKSPDGSITYTRPDAPRGGNSTQGGTLMGTPPEIGGAVAGGAYGAAQPAESEQERAQNIIKGAAGGALVGSGARAAGKVLASKGAKGPFGERLGIADDAGKAVPEGAPKKKLPPEIEQPLEQGVQQELQGQGQPGGSNIPDSALAQQAKETLERAKGTPEQAAELRPPEEGYAGNVNLAKMPAAESGIKGVFDDAQYNQFAGQRRGVVHDPQLDEAARLLADERTTEDWLKIKPGTALNDTEQIALGQTLVKVWKEHDTLAATVLPKVSDGTVTAIELAQLDEMSLKAAALTAVRSGAGSEAGRSLRTFTKALGGEFGSRDAAIKAAYKAIGTTPEAFNQWTIKYMQAGTAADRYKLLQGLQRPSRLSQFLAWTTSNMLSGTKSLEINAFGAAVETINRPLLELTMDPRGAIDDVVAMLRAQRRAFGEFGQVLMEGVSEGRSARALAAGKADNIHPEAFAGKKGLIATPALRVFSGTDAYMAEVNRSGALAFAARQEARRTGKTVQEILANPTKAMVKSAEAEADRVIYADDPSIIAKKILELRRLTESPEASKRAVGLVTYALAPFVKIPDVILTRGIRMLARPVTTPLRSGYRAAQKARGVYDGPIMTARERAQLIVTSSALAGIGVEAWLGNITGDGPKDPSKRAMLEQARDANGMPIWQRHSIKVGDRWLDYSNLGPLSVPMAAVASAVEGYRDEGLRPNPEYAQEIFSRTARVLLDASYIKAVGDMFKVVGEGRAADIGKSLGGNLLTRLVPYSGAVAQVARTMEGESKDIRTPIEAVMARIPGLADQVPPRLTPFGEPKQAPEDIVSSLSPLKTSAPGRPDRAAMESLKRGIAPSAVGKTIGGLELSREQHATYQKMTGAELRQRLDRLIQSAAYRMAPEAKKQQMFKQAVNEAKDEGKAKFIKQLSPANRKKAEQKAGSVVAPPIGGSR